MNWQKNRQNVIDRIAYVSGGVDRDQNVLLVVSTSPSQEVAYEHLVSLLALLSETLPPSTHFTILLDARSINNKQLKFYLRACQQALYKKVRHAIIIEPEKFLDQQKINFDLIVNGYSLKTILISMHKLTKYVDISQLPEEFGGTMSYDPDAWLKRRLDFTKWIDYLDEVGIDRSKHLPQHEADLNEFITRLCSIKRVDDKYSADQLLAKLNSIKLKEERDNKEELIEEHATGVNRLLDWLEGSGGKWLNSLCQISDNVGEADSLVRQHEQLSEKTKEIEEQTSQLVDVATRLMAVCPQYSISLNKMREQLGQVSDDFSRRVDAQTQFAISNREFQSKVSEFNKRTDAMLENLCADDVPVSSTTLEAVNESKKQLDDQLSDLATAFDEANTSGREAIQKVRYFEDCLPADQFIGHLNSTLSFIIQRFNRCNDLTSVKRLKQQQLIQLLTTYDDLDQAIKWLSELKTTLYADYSIRDIDETSIEQLRNDRHNLDQTAQSTYEYGRQLLQMAKASERNAMRVSVDDEREKKLDEAWNQLSEAIQQNEARLRVVESFMVTHRQMLQRINEIEGSLIERQRQNQKLTETTLCTERRRLDEDVEELMSIARMLSAQINSDHNTSVENRQEAMKQIQSKVDEVANANRKMQSLIKYEAESSSPEQEVVKPRSKSKLQLRTLSNVAEEDDIIDDSDEERQAEHKIKNIRLIDNHLPIRLSKNESYL